MGKTTRTRRDGGERRRGRVVLRGVWLVGVYLCWGLVLTVLVAWGFAWGTTWKFSSADPFALDDAELPATFFVVVRMIGATDFSAYQEYSTVAELEEAREIYEPVAVPWYARHLETARTAPEPPATVSVTAFGLPWRAAAYEVRQVDVMSVGLDRSDTRHTELFGEWVIPGVGLPGRSPLNDTDLVLPLLPLWRGLIANTLFYALLVWLLRRGFVVVRGWRRSRRGRCGWRGGCGYDLSGSVGEVCPECGRPVGGGGGVKATAELAE